MDYDNTYNFSTQSGSDDDWTLSGPEGNGIQNRNTDGYWCWTDSGTDSTATGPPSGTACIYTETSSPVVVDDEFTMTLKSDLDASTYGFYIDINVCLYGDTAGRVYLEAYDGTSWNILETYELGAGQSFESFTGIDCTSYTNSDFLIRFRTVVGGTTFYNDFAVEEVRIYGDKLLSNTIFLSNNF
jgi:hypothetical protein